MRIYSNTAQKAKKNNTKTMLRTNEAFARKPKLFTRVFIKIEFGPGIPMVRLKPGLR